MKKLNSADADPHGAPAPHPEHPHPCQDCKKPQHGRKLYLVVLSTAPTLRIPPIVPGFLSQKQLPEGSQATPGAADNADSWPETRKTLETLISGVCVTAAIVISKQENNKI